MACRVLLSSSCETRWTVGRHLGEPLWGTRGERRRVAKEKEREQQGRRRCQSQHYFPRANVPPPCLGLTRHQDYVTRFVFLRYQLLMNNSIDGGRLADRSSRQKGDGNRNHWGLSTRRPSFPREDFLQEVSLLHVHLLTTFTIYSIFNT
jgi:hypothetical protein